MSEACRFQWTATSDSDWVVLGEGVPRAARYADLTLTIHANPTPTPRSAILTIAGTAFPITQEPAEHQQGATPLLFVNYGNVKSVLSSQAQRWVVKESLVQDRFGSFEFAPDGTRAYGCADSQILELDPLTFVKTGALARDCYGIRVSPDGRLYVTRLLDSSGGTLGYALDVVDPTTGNLIITLSDIRNFTWSNDGSRLYFVSPGTRTLRVVETAGFATLRDIPFGAPSSDATAFPLGVSNDGRFLYIAEYLTFGDVRLSTIDLEAASVVRSRTGAFGDLLSIRTRGSLFVAVSATGGDLHLEVLDDLTGTTRDFLLKRDILVPAPFGSFEYTAVNLHVDASGRFAHVFFRGYGDGDSAQLFTIDLASSPESVGTKRTTHRGRRRRGRGGRWRKANWAGRPGSRPTC